MEFGTTVRRAVGVLNSGVAALMRLPGLGPLLQRQLITITYAGRRSGRIVTFPVGYRRRGDIVTNGVEFPT